MKTMVKSLAVGAILAVCAGAAFAADSATGTWNLNLAKSTFSPGPAPKSQTRTYAESPDGTALTVTTTTADGKQLTESMTFKYDGKPYPVTGDPDFDSVSVKKVNGTTVHSTQMKAGATIGTGVRSVSKDGKTLTFKQKGTHADGTKYDNAAVYDKQ